MPGIVRMTLTIRSPVSSSARKSSPYTLIASSPLTPLTASSMLSAIGCEKFHSTPGILSSSRFIAAISSSLLSWKTGLHSSFGFRLTKYSVLKNPVVSVPSSGRPT